LRLGLLAAALAWAPHGLEAQQQPPQQPGEPAPDSTEDRIRERLRRLARPIGYDSVLYVEDSLRVAAAEQGVRPTMAASGDSVLSALAGMPGYSLTRYEGAAADFAAGERILVLQAPPEGRARVSREGIQVEADSSITFDETSGRMRTVGMATFTPPDGEPVNSQDMIYDLNEGRGSATGARTEFSEGGARWFMTGDMPYAATDSTFLSHARFTTCELEEPHYHFETDEIKVVGGKLLVARGVRLYFADVPVAWLPFMAQSLEQGRASGLLTPRFSINDIVRTSSGYQRRLSNLGFYWAMSDYTDAVVAFDWFSDAFVSLETGFQYRVNRQFLDGTANVRTFWRTEGNRAISFDTNHNWEPDERTRIGIAARYAQETELVTDYSLDPRESTRSIESNAGLDRRFDWGSLSLSARRAEYLSDERIEWDLPRVNLSFSSRTLFPAPSATANAFNNMTWSARTSFARSTMDRAEQETFSRGFADTETRTASAGTRLGIGNLSVSPSVNFRETATMDVPESLIGGGPLPPGEPIPAGPLRDIARAQVSLSASVSYQQQLIGSTTLTPDLTVAREMLRNDESPLAQSFVAGPTRLSLGARLKTDIYGFFPGFGSFEAIRHKLSPSISYQWSPEARPDELQRAVFGDNQLQARNIVSLGLNQTFEARRRPNEDEPRAQAGDFEDPDPLAVTDSAVITDLTPQVPDTAGTGPRRLERSPVVKLLGLNTNVVTYDFVEADSLGSFLGGFQTVSLSNQISSDYLRGLSISVVHDLFQDTTVDGVFHRELAPRLSSLNFGFSLSSRSSIVRWLGLGGGGGGRDDFADDATEEELDELEDPFLDDPLLGEQSMIPGRRSGTTDPAATQARSDSEVGSWSARIGYALQRPRAQPDLLSQMLSGTLTLRPTENWDLSWRTSYDVEARAVNDHVIRLTRDLHEWEAHFDFLQTATGNWSFRFEVALTGLRDLKFDYRQRNLDVGRPSETEAP